MSSVELVLWILVGVGAIKGLTLVVKKLKKRVNKSKDYDDLEKLQKLKDKGTITDDQFQKERDKITNRWD